MLHNHHPKHRHLRLVKGGLHTDHRVLSDDELAQVADGLSIIFADTARAQAAFASFSEDDRNYLTWLRDGADQLTAADHQRLTLLALHFQRNGGC